MNDRIKKILAFGLILSGGCLLLILAPAQAASETYWHFTLRALIDVDKAEEWARVTMVEVPKAEVFPETAATVKQLGGVLSGTILAHVRGAAWFFAHGQVLDSSRDSSNAPALFRFKFGLSEKQVLMEDGRQHEVRDLVSPVIGPIYVGGGREEWLGKPRLDGITCDDVFVHYKFCGRTWVEQPMTPLMHYDSTNLKA